MCAQEKSFVAGACVFLCASWSLIAALGFALLITSTTLAFGLALPPHSSAKQISNSAAQKVFTGVITDSFCQARHAPDSGKSPAESVSACLRKGAKLMLVDGEKSYLLQGNSART